MKASSERVRPAPIQIHDRSEIRGNHSYLIVPAKPAKKDKEAADGEAVSGS